MSLARLVLMFGQEFDEALLGSVDFAFLALGKSCQQALYFYLRTTGARVERGEIPSRVQEFDDFLRIIFKDGALVLERLILKRLCHVFGVAFEERGVCGFVEAVSKIRSLAVDRECAVMIPEFRKEVALVKEGRGGVRFE